MIFIKIPPFSGIVQTKEVSSICVHSKSGYANHLHFLGKFNFSRMVLRT